VALRRCLHTSAVQPRGRWPFYNRHQAVTDPSRQDPHYFEKKAETLTIDKSYLDNLAKLYQEKVGSNRELLFKREDNLVQHDNKCWLPEIDASQPCLAYRNIDALKTAPESVKRIFSIEYGERKDLTDAWKDLIIGQVKKHPLDTKSLEARIARATALIRQWTLLIEDIAKKTPKRPTWLTIRLYEMINHRRKLMKLLRQEDEASFERLLQELKIAYHVPPLPEDEQARTRKAWSEAQIRRRVEAEKERRLNEFRQELATKRERFNAMKDKRLKELDLEEQSIRNKLQELTTIDGKVLDVKGTYQGRTIDCISEDKMHDNLFYHKKVLPLKNT